jgi:hypothetical protein
VLGQGNIGRGLLDIHYKEQQQKCLYRLATTRLRKNNIDTLLRLYLCVRATTAKPPRGIAKGVLGLGGVAKGVLPSYSLLAPPRGKLTEMFMEIYIFIPIQTNISTSKCSL